MPIGSAESRKRMRSSVATRWWTCINGIRVAPNNRAEGYVTVSGTASLKLGNDLQLAANAGTAGSVDAAYGQMDMSGGYLQVGQYTTYCRPLRKEVHHRRRRPRRVHHDGRQRARWRPAPHVEQRGVERANDDEGSGRWSNWRSVHFHREKRRNAKCIDAGYDAEFRCPHRQR